MPTKHPLRRWLTAGLVAVVFMTAVRVAMQPSQPLSARAEDKSPARSVNVMFGGTPSRNMVNLVDRGVPIEWDKEGKNVKWKAALGSKSYGGPTISGGKIFIGTNNEAPRNPAIKGDKGIIMCFNEADGQFLWQAVHDKLPSGQVNDWPKEGICSTPIVEGDRLWYVSNRCTVVCADVDGMANGNQGLTTEKYNSKTDADIIWEYDMMKELNVFPHNLAVCSPLILGDILFIVTANGVDEGHIKIPNPEAPSFIALNKKTGQLLWKDASPGTKIMHGQWSNPTLATINGQPQVIFPGGDGILYAFTPDTGKLLWKFDCNPKTSKYELGGKGTRSDFIATPVVKDGKVYIGTGQDPEHYEGVGHLWCIDPSKATETNVDLSPKNDNFDPKAPVNKDSGLVWHYGGPVKEGQESDRDYYFGRTMSTVAIHDGLCYAAELAGYLHCLDAQTGKLHWVHDLKSAVWGSPYYVDGKVYIGTEDGDVWIFEHGAKKKELGKIEMDAPVRSTPVVAHGVLYVMSERTLWAIAAKK